MTVIRPNSVSGINSITVQSGNSLAVHKADGTLIQTIAGATGVSTFSSVSVGSGYTDNSAAKSINIGLGASISQHNDNSLSFGTNGDERFQVNDSGKILIATTTTSEAHANQDELIIGSSSDDANHGITIVTPNDKYGTVAYSDGSGGTSQGLLEYNHSGDFFRIYTAASERLRITSGRVSAVGIVSATDGFEVGTAATIKSNGNATFSGIVTATSFKGDGSGLSGVTAVTINNNADNRLITGSDTANTLNGEANLTLGNNLQFTTTANGHSVLLKSTGNFYNKLSFDANRTSAGDTLGFIDFSWDTDKVADIMGVAGSDTTNKDDGHLVFRTSPAQGSIAERLRIASDGQATFDKGAPGSSNQVIARFQAESSRALDIVWHDSGSLLGFDTPGNHSYIFKVNSTEKMRLTSTGLGINSDANGPDKLLHVSDSNNGGAVTPFRLTNVNGTSGTEVRMELECGVDEIAYIGAKNEGSDIGPLMFATATSQAAYPTEKMRLTNDGRLLIHTTTSYNGFLSAYALSGQPYPIAAIGGNTSQGLIGLYYSTSLIGSITITGGGSSVAYNTSSDYRLKENAVAISDGITRLKTLKPYRFNWKVDSSNTVDGFFAHEVTAVPEAISGTKDEVATEDNEETGVKKGDPIYQKIDQSKLVPLLTAALQEAVSKIEVLETKVAALEGG